MEEQNPHFQAKVTQLKKILTVVDRLPPAASPRAKDAVKIGCLVGFAVLALCIVVGCSPGLALALTVGGGVASSIAVRRFGKQPNTVVHELEPLLIAYDPVCKYAYRDLQKRVARYGYSRHCFSEWETREICALVALHEHQTSPVRVQTTGAKAPELEARFLALKEIKRAVSKLESGMNPRATFAAFWGLVVFGTVGLLPWLDIASRHATKVASPSLGLLTMLIYYGFSKKPKSYLPSLKKQLANYVPFGREKYQALLSSAHIFGWRTELVKDWAWSEEVALEELELEQKGLPEDSFVGKRV